MKIKMIIVLLILMLTGCSGNTSFMDRALVGTVDGQYITVMFPAGERNGVKYYKPQFQSECPYNKIYQADNISTGCRIRDSRITNLHPYREHTEQPAIARSIEHVIPDNGTVE